MKKILISIIGCMLIAVSVWSQSSDATIELEKLISNFFDNNSVNNDFINGSRSPASSEAVFCILDIDSVGNVSDVHFLADDQKKDLAYATISKLKPSDFKTWQEAKYKNKIIMMPIVFRNYAESKIARYIDDLIIRAIETPKLTIGQTVFLQLSNRSPLSERNATPSYRVNEMSYLNLHHY